MNIKIAAILSGILPCVALAAPTVTFEGEVTDQTCSVMINGQSNSVVMLPTVSTTSFDEPLANGAVAGETPFTVSVSGCTDPVTDLSIKTTFLGYDVDAASGVLGNRATNNAAEGYGIQLTRDSAGSDPIILNGATSVEGLTLPGGQTSASYEFGARYYVIDASNAKPGKITAVAEYTLSYF